MKHRSDTIDEVLTRFPKCPSLDEASELAFFINSSISTLESGSRTSSISISSTVAEFSGFEGYNMASSRPSDEDNGINDVEGTFAIVVHDGLNR